MVPRVPRVARKWLNVPMGWGEGPPRGYTHVANARLVLKVT